MNVGADAFNMQLECVTLDRLLSFRTERFCLAILVTFILCPSTVLSQSLWGLWVLVRTGLFEPSECFWPVRGLILNAVLPLLPSCWGVSFVLGCGVSPQSRSPATPPPLQRLPSCWGFSALGHGVSPRRRSHATQPLLPHQLI